MQNGLSKIKLSKAVILTNKGYYKKIASFNMYTKN